MALWPCLALPSPMRTTPCVPVMPPWPCRRPCVPTPRKYAALGAWSCACGWGSTLAKWWCVPSAMTCIWTTQLWGRPRSWRHVWNRRPRRAASASRLRPCAWWKGWYRFNALGPVPVKGLVEPVEVFELLGASGIRRRLQAAVARGLTRFVGRDQELVGMQQALTQAEAGHGQVVALVGEPGVGKSRLVYEFTHSHCTQAWRVLESASVPYGKATPHFPVFDLLRRVGPVED